LQAEGGQAGAHNLQSREIVRPHSGHNAGLHSGSSRHIQAAPRPAAYESARRNQHAAAPKHENPRAYGQNRENEGHFPTPGPANL